MPQNFRVDQAASFTHVILMSTAPKTKLRSDAQEVNGAGIPKWEVQVAAGFHQFGKITNEILKIGIASEKDPGQGITPLSPVYLVDFEIGIMEKTDRGGENVIGHHVWYRASALKPISAK